MTNQPNFLIISADHHRADCLGVAGRKVRTPHLDALARSGIRFGSCITPSVACQPARASILTGQLCLTHGVHDDGMDLDPGIGERGFAGTLANSGYDTAFFGRAHFSAFHPRAPSGTPECFLSSARYDDTWFGPYMGFKHVELTLDGKDGFDPAEPPRGQHYERFFHADGQGEKKMHAYRSNKGRSRNPQTCWHSGLATAHHNTTWTADRAIEWLRYGRDENKPFCSWISFADIQHPYDCPEPWSRLHKPCDVDLPLHRTRDPDTLPWWHRAALERENSTQDTVPVESASSEQTAHESDDELREIIANTYGNIAFIDDQIGKIMNNLADLGLSENTHVFYLSDHGDWLGDHGLTATGPMLYDCLLKVPMIWSGPGVPDKRVNYEPVSTIDLSPSLMELAGVEPQLEQHGQSLCALLDVNSKRDFAMSEWELLPLSKRDKISLRSVRTRTYKLTKDMNSGLGELYDLLVDPNEMNNLFDNPNSVDVKMRLESYLLLRHQDVLLESNAA